MPVFTKIAIPIVLAFSMFSALEVVHRTQDNIEYNRYTYTYVTNTIINLKETIYYLQRVKKETNSDEIILTLFVYDNIQKNMYISYTLSSNGNMSNIKYPNTLTLEQMSSIVDRYCHNTSYVDYESFICPIFNPYLSGALTMKYSAHRELVSSKSRLEYHSHEINRYLQSNIGEYINYE